MSDANKTMFYKSKTHLPLANANSRYYDCRLVLIAPEGCKCCYVLINGRLVPKLKLIKKHLRSTMANIGWIH